MVRRPESRHARPSGRAAVAAAYDRVQAELTSVRSQHWTDQLEMIRLASLTRELTTQVSTLQTELATVRDELSAARSAPPVVVEVPAAGWSSVAPPETWAASAPLAPPAWAPSPPGWAPAAQPAWAPQPYAAPPEAWVAQAAAAQQQATMREDLLLQEMAELRRLVAHQQTLLADLTVRLLDLLARFIPVVPVQQPTYAAPPQPQPYPTPQPAPEQPAASYAPPTTLYQAPDDLVMDDETASRLRVIREAFGR